VLVGLLLFLPDLALHGWVRQPFPLVGLHPNAPAAGEAHHENTDKQSLRTSDHGSRPRMHRATRNDLISWGCRWLETNSLRGSLAIRKTCTEWIGVDVKQRCAATM
jgi:hypothetical protein